jgi:hypothetical protein
MNKPITKKEWMEYIEKTWDAAQEEALAQQEQKPVPWKSFFNRYCPWLEQPAPQPEREPGKGGEHMTEYTLRAPTPPVGGYRIGGGVQFNLTKKPCWLHRMGVRLVLGWEWVDA